MSKSTNRSDEQEDQPWTQDEAAEFAQRLRTFREGLPSRQRDALDAILHASAHAVGGDDVEGYLLVPLGPLLATITTQIPTQPAVSGGHKVPVILHDFPLTKHPAG